MAVLILLYSRAGENYVNGSVENLQVGNSRVVAEYIRKAADAEIFEIETEVPYPADYYETIEIAKKELKEQARPALRRRLSSLDGYDTVIVCGPCWWGTYPMAVFSQLENLDFSGHRVFAVMTHEGSGLGHCERDLRKTCKGAAFGEGLAVHGAEAAGSEEAAAAWVARNLQAPGKHCPGNCRQTLPG